ncbi:MAG TPA: hypothetical protein VJ233_01755 [Hyphomicrobiaceae bacterium]|nr:hypothetical protein [Hyphomicrobiaceae bacterium]
MKLSIATVSLSGGLAEKLDAIAAAGFKGVEIFENDLLSFNGTPAGVRKLVADLGLESVQRLEANGVALLPVPDNYYDDLETKTNLPPDRIEALKKHSILYDQDGSAEYLQVYTQTFDDRFFFEIVERRGYKGFGAVNAPIRLAAQSRLAKDLAIP